MNRRENCRRFLTDLILIYGFLVSRCFATAFPIVSFQLLWRIMLKNEVLLLNAGPQRPLVRIPVWTLNLLKLRLHFPRWGHVATNFSLDTLLTEFTKLHKFNKSSIIAIAFSTLLNQSVWVEYSNHWNFLFYQRWPIVDKKLPEVTICFTDCTPLSPFRCSS